MDSIPWYPSKSHTFASAKEFIFSPMSVCLIVNWITQKLLMKSLRNFIEWLDIIQRPID